jgi:hypothetical protein
MCDHNIARSLESTYRYKFKKFPLKKSNRGVARYGIFK